jgi:cell division septal protein FtsQ
MQKKFAVQINSSVNSAVSDARNRKKRKMKWKEFFIRAAYWLVVFLFIFVGLWVLIFSPFMRVDSVDIIAMGGETDLYREAVSEELRGRYLNLVPKNSLLLLPVKKIEKRLKEQFPLIKSVEAARIFPKGLGVVIDYYQGVLIWCERQECYLTDETGEAFYKLNEQQGLDFSAKFITVEELGQRTINVGNRIASAQDIYFALELPEILKSKLGMEIEKKMITPSVLAGEYRVRTKQGWSIYFNAAMEPEWQVNVLNSILQQAMLKDKQAEIEYIDLRLKDKVIFKLKNSEPQEQLNEGQEGENQPAVDNQKDISSEVEKKQDTESEIKEKKKPRRD